MSTTTQSDIDWRVKLDAYNEQQGELRAAIRRAVAKSSDQRIAALEARCAEMETTINMLVHSLLDNPIQGGAPVLLTDASPAYDTAAGGE